MRIVKYLGSAHGTDEYPFLIDQQGFSIMPLSSLGLDHLASTEPISRGIARLDAMCPNYCADEVRKTLLNRDELDTGRLLVNALNNKELMLIN